MVNENDSSRWQEIAAVRDDFDSDVALPRITSRVDGLPRQPSARALSLAQALSVSTSWSRISDAQRRLAA